MSDMDILKELLKNDALVPLTLNYKRYKVVLKEPQSPTSQVEIAGIPQNTFVVKIDKFFDSSTIFNGNKGECKRADYAIITEYNSKKKILCIEMKKTKGSKAEIIQQLRGAICVLKYCQEIGKQFWNKSKFLDGFEYRFISFGHTAIRKRRTRITKKTSLKHDTPENMMKIDWPANIRFNKLAGA
jgi:hypothetical protein